MFRIKKNEGNIVDFERKRKKEKKEEKVNLDLNKIF